MTIGRTWFSPSRRVNRLLFGGLCVFSSLTAAPMPSSGVDRAPRAREKQARRAETKARKDKERTEAEEKAAKEKLEKSKTQSTTEKKPGTTEKSNVPTPLNSTAGEAKRTPTNSPATPQSQPSEPMPVSDVDSKMPPMEIARRTLEPTKPNPAELSTENPWQSALALLAESRTAMVSIRDYTATLHKKENVRGRMIEQTLEVQIRGEPFSVHLKFIQPYKGREVIYVAGQNRGKMLVRAEGFKAFAGTLSFSPTGSEAMAENRHPITEIGFVNLLDFTIRQWELERKTPQNAEVRIKDNVSIGQQSCRLIEVTRKTKTPDALYHLTRIYLSKETELPVQVENYDWPQAPGSQPLLLEEYTYSNLQTNVGLTDRNFK